ncbi:hypothetical protein Tco_0528279 [Tanacetum coccineum]
MSNMYEDPIYDEVGTSYDSSIPSKVQDQDNYSDNVDEYYQEHETQSDVKHNYVVNSDADYTSDSNIILYDQYMEDNEEHVVQSNVSSARNDALMSIIDDMHEQGVQSMSANKQVKVVNNTLTSELADIRNWKEVVILIDALKDSLLYEQNECVRGRLEKVLKKHLQRNWMTPLRLRCVHATETASYHV